MTNLDRFLGRAEPVRQRFSACIYDGQNRPMRRQRTETGCANWAPTRPRGRRESYKEGTKLTSRWVLQRV